MNSLVSPHPFFINQSKPINLLFNPIAVTTESQGAVATYILKFDSYKIIKSFAFASRGLIHDCERKL